MRHKVENDASAWLRSTVEKRGRNADAGRDHHSRGQGVHRKGSARPAPDRPDRAQTSRSCSQALDGREITRFDGRKEVLHLAAAEVVPYDLTLRERIISSIADPNVGFILLVVGALGLYVEFNSPGLIIAGRRRRDSAAAGTVVAGGAAAQLGRRGAAAAGRARCSSWRRTSPRTGFWAPGAPWRWFWAR